jgi:hypothetical protein
MSTGWSTVIIISLPAGQEKIAGVDLVKQTHNPRQRMKILHFVARAEGLMILTVRMPQEN